MLAGHIGFKYDFFLAPGDKLGHLKASDGSWDGAIGEIVNDVCILMYCHKVIGKLSATSPN